MSAALGSEETAGIAARAAPVLEQAGVPRPYRLEPITGGGNNRVFRVDAGGDSVVLKVYFRHPDDPRDRLRADFGFSGFAWGVGSRSLPRPLASDREAGMAVYEFVAGTKLGAGEVTAAHIAEAAAFFRSVNEHRGSPRATGLPEASEACFTIAAHVECVDRRLERLRGIRIESPLETDAVAAIGSRMRPAWARIRAAVIAASGNAAGKPLAFVDRCLSPSDFGFHNAILAGDGRLRFLDFEYAGWDDPAKMACDFFCQPAVPVPAGLFDGFVAALAPLWHDPAGFADRAAILLPVYRLKWCCIMLNEFLPAADSRRMFAGAVADRDARRAVQLAKVGAALDLIGA